MRAAVITYPGSNCDRDLKVALEAAGMTVTMVWHKNTDLPDGLDLVAIPGGFSFGDYLRCGAIAAHSPITRAVIAHAERGGYVLGICNGFQVLTEARLLPGALLRNASLKYICRSVPLRVEAEDSAYLNRYRPGAEITLPVAHHDGNYFAEPAELDRLEAEGRVAFRYLAPFNGSARDIAGVLSANRRVLGMMPHPERAADAVLGLSDGKALFTGLAEGLIAA